MYYALQTNLGHSDEYPKENFQEFSASYSKFQLSCYKKPKF